MPRVTIKKKEYKITDLSKWLVGKIYEKNMRQRQVAALIGISQPAFCNRLKKGLFSYGELLTLFKELDITDEEILKIMKL